jgi:hypothetical protein
MAIICTLKKPLISFLMQILSKVLFSNGTGIMIYNGSMCVIKMPDTLDLVNLFMIML